MVPKKRKRKPRKQLRLNPSHGEGCFFGLHFDACVFCGATLVLLNDPQIPGKMVPVHRGTWLQPVKNRTRYYIRGVHERHRCWNGKQATFTRIREYEREAERASRPEHLQDPYFDWDGGS